MAPMAVSRPISRVLRRTEVIRAIAMAKAATSPIGVGGINLVTTCFQVRAEEGAFLALENSVAVAVTELQVVFGSVS